MIFRLAFEEAPRQNARSACFLQVGTQDGGLAIAAAQGFQHIQAVVKIDQGDGWRGLAAFFVQPGPGIGAQRGVLWNNRNAPATQQEQRILERTPRGGQDRILTDQEFQRTAEITADATIFAQARRGPFEDVHQQRVVGVGVLLHLPTEAPRVDEIHGNRVLQILGMQTQPRAEKGLELVQREQVHTFCQAASLLFFQVPTADGQQSGAEEDEEGDDAQPNPEIPRWTPVVQVILTPMKIRNLGNSGLKVPPVAFGSWITFGTSGAQSASAMVDYCLDHDLFFFDTADIYDVGKAEEILGAALRGRPRAALVVATKLYWPMSEAVNDRGLSRKHVVESINASLRRLQLDHVDLYQCHRFDEETPLAETVGAMGDLIRQGKILYWGTSCWTGEQLRQACSLADQLGVPRPISEQPPYNMVSRDVELEVLPTCAELGIGVINWSPLAQGFLTGKYQRGARPPADSRAAQENRPGTFLDEILDSAAAWQRLERIEEVAQEFGLSLPQLALAWCLRRPELTAVILGATRIEQIEQNLAALEVRWSEELDQACEQALAGAALGI